MPYSQKNNNIINIYDTYVKIGDDLLVDEGKTRIDTSSLTGYKGKIISSDAVSSANKRKTRLPGIIITDTYNHFAFPIRHPVIDTGGFDLPLVYKHFSEYIDGSMQYLPWHFVVEYITDRYYVFNTRPIDHRFPLTIDDVCDIRKKRKASYLNDSTEQFFKKSPIQIEECLHVAVIGDSTVDIYPRSLYQVIGHQCLAPILTMYKLPKTMNSKTWCLNMGTKFKAAALEFSMKK
jgi:hypothetical protein